MDPILAAGPAGPPSPDIHATQDFTHLRDAAVRLEASFLAEMLKNAGMGSPPDAFGGGAGEDQFSSFLVREQAQEIARAGGIGLAETIFEALKSRSDV